MTFGKPGRPPEDRLLRQREIYESVAPLIEAHGPRGFSMREAAHAACMSVGGLYHYFPTKRDLVLHGLDPNARERICSEQRARLVAASEPSQGQLVDIWVDTALRVIAFMRPSVVAAQDLSGGTLQDTLDSDWTNDVGDLVGGLRAMLPADPLEDLTALARLMRRVMIGALIERDVDMEVVRSDLRRLIAAHVPETPTVPTESPHSPVGSV